MTDAYDVRFPSEVTRNMARAVGESMTMTTGRGAETTDARVRVRHLLDDNAHLKRLLGEERERLVEARTLLRSALWELARAQGSNVPQRFIADWYRTRRVML